MSGQVSGLRRLVRVVLNSSSSRQASGASLQDVWLIRPHTGGDRAGSGSGADHCGEQDEAVREEGRARDPPWRRGPCA